MPAISALRSILLLIAACATIAPATAATKCAIRPADEIIEVNVRPACCSTNAARLAETMLVREYVASSDGGRTWIQSDLSHVANPASDEAVTIFYVHGNKVDPHMARDRGIRVYRALAKRSCDERPMRFVIFSWPATETGGLLRDFRIKAARTRPCGWQLAWILNQMASDAQVSLLGYSYGARIVGGAAHVLAGGALNGLRLPDAQPGNHAPMRVAYFAAATHAYWFGPRSYHSQAMQQIDRLMLLNNELDPAMRFYSLVDKNGHPQAMGLRGPTCLTAESRQRVRCFDCSKCVGRSHDLFKYTATGRTMTSVWKHLMYVD